MIFFTKVSNIDGVFLWTVFPERAEVCQSTNGRQPVDRKHLHNKRAVHYRSMKNRNKMCQVILSYIIEKYYSHISP